MPTLGDSTILSADKPLVDPAGDRLEYAPFAKHLADAISRMAPAEGMVVAIYGSWGLGKSTVLNFVEYYFMQMPAAQQPAVVRFNPWWFSGQEDLTKRFFDQLQVTLKSRKVASAKVSRQIADFADAISDIPLPALSTAKGVAKLARVIQKDVVALRRIVADALREQKRRILIVIDDIDRLSADEIRQLFALIKAVVDFPNTVYLLAFDKDVVTEALEQVQGVGEAYLEKIVQVPFQLPIPDKTSLRSLLFERVGAIIGADETFDQTYWGNVYFEGIDHFIVTPRNITSLTNTLTVTYPAVKGEVNPVDFIAIESLRVFCPMVYDVIRRNGGMFAGYANLTGLGGPGKSGLELFHNSWLGQLPEENREPIKKLIIRLFPKLESVWGNTYYSAEREAMWRRELRVCSLDKFQIYFRLAVPEGNITNVEMRSLLALLGDSKVFAERLVTLANQKRPDGTTRVRAFLEYLQDYTQKDIPINCIAPILTAFFQVGDQLLRPEDERRGMFDWGNDVWILRVTWQLLERLDERSRFTALKDAMSQGKAVSMIVAGVTSLGHQHGKYAKKQPDPENERLISVQHLKELEDCALEKIRQIAQQDSLMQSPQLLRVLYRWRDWGGAEEVKQWVEGIVKSDEGLADFIGKLLQESHSQTMTDVVGKSHYRLDPQWIESFLEPSQIIERVRNIATDTNLPEHQRIAASQFIREYGLRQQGKDPGSPEALMGII